MAALDYAVPAGPQVSLQIDDVAEAAYLRLGPGPVARTVEFSDVIWVDLDEHGVVVGVELLDLGTSVPLDEIEARHHINSGALALLKSIIRPTSAQQIVGASATPSATSLTAGRPARC